MKAVISTQQPATAETEKSPSGFSIIWRELIKDKMAVISMIVLGLILVTVYGMSLILNENEIVKVDLLSIYAPPSAEHWLGTDYGGRDIFGQLIIGAKNSFTIGLRSH